MTEVLAPAIELPIVFYDHPERLGDIALVGMVHALPSTDFYEGIKSFVDNREWDGSQIHFEGVRDATHAELGRVDRNYTPKIWSFAYNV